MLKRLRVKNFTIFSDADFRFARGLNVIVGENGTGKSHVLKLAYSLLAVSAGSTRRERDTRPASPTRGHLDRAIADKLRAVFLPDELGRLATRKPRGQARCEIEAEFRPATLNVAFGFSTRSKEEVEVTTPPTAWSQATPVFLPTRELLTIAPNFVSLYEQFDLKFEETWRDTCVLLGAPTVRGRRHLETKELLDPLLELLGGDVVQNDAGNFYVTMKSGNMEAALVSEGQRKLAMVVRLLATGALTSNGYLFWDEPEANLNPAMIRPIATTILQLCRAGLQVFVATHSLFLMRELDILHRDGTSGFGGVKTCYTGLHRTAAGLDVKQGETVDDIGAITSLDEELKQSDRYLAVEDAS